MRNIISTETKTLPSSPHLTIGSRILLKTTVGTEIDGTIILLEPTTSHLIISLTQDQAVCLVNLAYVEGCTVVHMRGHENQRLKQVRAISKGPEKEQVQALMKKNLEAEKERFVQYLPVDLSIITSHSVNYIHPKACLLDLTVGFTCMDWAPVKKAWLFLMRFPKHSRYH